MNFCHEITVPVKKSLFAFNLEDDMDYLYSKQYLGFESDTISVQNKARPLFIKIQPALANFRDKFIFCTGGAPNGRPYSIDEYGLNDNSCTMYDIEKDVWTVGPTMLRHRWKHSCCILGDHLYTFSGMGMSSLEDIDSIQMIDAKKWAY